MKITPIGSKLIVLPLPTEEEEKVGSIVIPNSVATADLSRAEVVEISDDLAEKYKVGEILLYPTNAGLGLVYNNKPHLWLRQEENGIQEVWGKVTSSLPQKDKGHSL